MNSIRILLTGDPGYYFTGLQAELEALEGIRLIDAAPSTPLLPAVRQGQPDLVIVNLSGHHDLQPLRALHRQYPRLGVITLSVLEGWSDIALLLQAGVRGCLNSNCSPDTLRQALAAVLNDRFYISCHCAFCALQMKLPKTPYPLLPPTFSEREQAIIRHICAGDSNKQIAAHLHLSENMIERYRSRIRQKMGVKTASGIVVYAVRHGLYEPEE